MEHILTEATLCAMIFTLTNQLLINDLPMIKVEVYSKWIFILNGE